MAISICIPTYNRLPHLKRMMESFRNGAGDYPYEFIVGDGGSTDGTIEYLKKQKDATLVEMGELTGCVKAYNACFKKAKYEYIFWPSDDFIVFPKVLIKCCKLMDKHPDVGMVSPKFVEANHSNFPNVGTLKHRLILSKTHIFRTEVLKQIGLLNENYRTYLVDVDSALSVLNLGYVTMFTREVGIIHNRIYDEVRESNVPKKTSGQKERIYYEKRWKKLDLRIQTSLFKRKKAYLFWSVQNKMRKSCIINFFMQRNNTFAIKLFDWVLQRCVIFRAKDYNHLKDFYLAQKIDRGM